MADHKRQLLDRVEQRKAQLNESLQELQGIGGKNNEERIRDIEQALQALQTHIGGGWESVGDTQAAAINRWLESTANLGGIPSFRKDPDQVEDVEQGSASRRELEGAATLPGLDPAEFTPPPPQDQPLRAAR